MTLQPGTTPSLVPQRLFGSLLCWLLALAMGMSPVGKNCAAAEPARPVILLENRTYSPFWYRTRGASSWGEWRALLPGKKDAFNKVSRLTIEASLVGGQKPFTLQQGNTYHYSRATAVSEPQFVHDQQDRGHGRWRVPHPPQETEFNPYAQASFGHAAGLFRPLEQFINRCDQFGDEYKLSLNSLAAECAAAEQITGSIPADLRYVKGFTWFFGYSLDRKQDDIVLLGIKDPTRPPIDLDCVATVIKVMQEGATPFCSLDKHTDPRYQKSIISGVPWNTKWAEIMIDADYMMKKICQGQIDPQIPGMHSDWYYSYLESRLNWTGADTQQTEDRWWFNFDANKDRAVVSRDGSVALLYRNPVRVSTEKNVQGAYGTGITTPTAEQFAGDFTRHIETLGKHYTSVGELLALYRVYDLMYHARQLGQAPMPSIDYWTKDYEPPYAGPPEALPTLSREKHYRWETGDSVRRLTKWVEGGVSMQLTISPTSLERDQLDPGIAARMLERKDPKVPIDG